MRRSEQLASEAEVLVHELAPKEEIHAKYLEAAQAEEIDLRATGESKHRTRGILAVSTAALYSKASAFDDAIRIIEEFLKPNKLLTEYWASRLQEIRAAVKQATTGGTKP